MVDFQGVCLRRTIRYEKSSAERFHGVRSIDVFLVVVFFAIFRFILVSSNHFDDVLAIDQSFNNVKTLFCR